MDKAVLDSSILVKGIFKPLRSLSKDVYSRELETHQKCRRLLKLIDERDVDTYIPKACIVEMAAVSRRLSDKTNARKISKGLLESYEIANESLLFDTALMIAMDTGCSGFDSYFIALAKIKNACLLTDDSGMHHHARGAGIETVLIRDIDSEEIEKLFVRSL